MGNLFAAASRYYRALAPLETGGFNPEVIEGAEGKMKDAEAEILFVTDEYGSLWYDCWQCARFTKEKVNRDVHTVEDRRALWHEQAKELADRIERLKVLARQIMGA